MKAQQMTPNQLERLIVGDVSITEFAESLSALSEADRKHLSTSAQKLQKELYKDTPSKSASDLIREFVVELNAKMKKENERLSKAFGMTVVSGGHRDETTREVFLKAELAIYAVCPISVWKRTDRSYYPDNGLALQKIISDRSPEWLEEFIEFDLEREWSALSFSQIYSFIKSGLISKPTNEKYFEKYAEYLMRTGHHDEPKPPPISEQLLSDELLMEDVWSLFRVENWAFNTNSWLKKGAGEYYETWPEALIKLEQGGHLDRARLLDASLDGLSQDFKQNQLSGYHKFHKSLKPTTSEILSREDKYRDLLCHPIGHVMKFALDMLSKLERINHLSIDSTLSEVGAVFLAEGKGNATAAIKLIARIVKNSPHHKQLALSCLLDALRHPNSDIQELAFSLLKDNADDLSSGTRKSISDLTDFVSPSIRPSLLELIGNSHEPQEALSTPSDGDIEALLHPFDSKNLKAMGLSNETQDERFEYKPISSILTDLRVLHTVEQITPVQTADELITLIARTIEELESPDDVERIIDGVSRIPREGSDDFLARAKPITHRLEGGGAPNRFGLLFGWIEVQRALASLLMTWLTGKYFGFEQDSEDTWGTKAIAFRPMVLHLESIAKRISNGHYVQRLSSPTHSDGWIDPLIWVERAKSLESQISHIDKQDICYSFLRLAPDNRTEAAKSLEDMPQEIRPLAEFCFKVTDEPVINTKKDAAAWVSAARARDPFGDWNSTLRKLNIPSDWPDGAYPAIYSWSASKEEKTNSHNNYSWTVQQLNLEKHVAAVSPSAANNKTLKGAEFLVGLRKTTTIETIPTIAITHSAQEKHRWNRDYGYLFSIGMSQWLFYLWPQNPTPVYALGVDKLMRRIDDDGSNDEPGHGFLYGLFQKNRPWGELGHLILLMGLIGKDADPRGLSIDATIEGIESGQLDPNLMAQVLTKVSDGGWIKLNRLSQALSQIISVSPLHALIISDILQGWLPNADMKMRSMFEVLSVLLDCLSMTGTPLSNRCVDMFSSIKGSSKTAKTAKKLVELKFDNTLSETTLRGAVVDARARFIPM
ncbi:MAG: DUF6493 family protein [Pseudomonadota bacterium]